MVESVLYFRRLGSVHLLVLNHVLLYDAPDQELHVCGTLLWMDGDHEHHVLCSFWSHWILLHVCVRSQDLRQHQDRLNRTRRMVLFSDGDGVCLEARSLDRKWM